MSKTEKNTSEKLSTLFDKFAKEAGSNSTHPIRVAGADFIHKLFPGCLHISCNGDSWEVKESSHGNEELSKVCVSFSKATSDVQEVYASGVIVALAQEVGVSIGKTDPGAQAVTERMVQYIDRAFTKHIS